MTLLPFDLQKALAGHPVATRTESIPLEIVLLNKASAKVSLVVVHVNDIVKLHDARTGRLEVERDCGYDLFLLAPEPKKVKGWINVYDNGTVKSVTIWDSKEQADLCKSINRIACIPIEFTEGEGLGDGK